MSRPASPVPMMLLTLAVALPLRPADAKPPSHASPGATAFVWQTVVNNSDLIPTDTCSPESPGPLCRTFNSYNPPSVNTGGLVVFRARSRGGMGMGQGVHGVYTRDMAAVGPVVRVLDRTVVVPQPNNRGTTFIEPPAFPRIDIHAVTVVTRGNHPPAWSVFDDGGGMLEQLGTSGIYSNPFGPLITGASKLGSVAAFSFFEVPEAPGTAFDVFPGSPAVTNGDILVFKGNWTDAAVSRTGVYYRRLTDAPIPSPYGGALTAAGGTHPITLIANSRNTLIPRTATVFGSVAPPSAVDGKAVFAGFDDEDTPTLGGIYLAPLVAYPLTMQPELTALVNIGDRVPEQPRNATFNHLGEAISYDGRFVAFWGAWGEETRTVRLYCPQEGNRDRIDYCNQTLEVEGEILGDAASICDDTSDPMYGVSCYQEREGPVNQGIFVVDTRGGPRSGAQLIAAAGGQFADFVYWNYSGRVPGVGESDEDGEAVRWRSASFVAVSGRVQDGLADPGYHVAFKARSGTLDPVTHTWIDPVDGIYLAGRPGVGSLETLIETGMEGARIDAAAVDASGKPLPVTELNLERDGFRGDILTVTLRMGSEEDGWAGVYLTRVQSGKVRRRR